MDKDKTRIFKLGFIFVFIIRPTEGALLTGEQVPTYLPIA